MWAELLCHPCMLNLTGETGAGLIDCNQRWISRFFAIEVYVGLAQLAGQLLREASECHGQRRLPASGGAKE